MGFPCSSAGKESTCNAGDPGSIPGLGRSTGEEIGYPLQYSWASLMAQMVKNLPIMWETWVGKIPLEKGTATHSSILAWRIPDSFKEFNSRSLTFIYIPPPKSDLPENQCSQAALWFLARPLFSH